MQEQEVIIKELEKKVIALEAEMGRIKTTQATKEQSYAAALAHGLKNRENTN